MHFFGFFERQASGPDFIFVYHVSPPIPDWRKQTLKKERVIKGESASRIASIRVKLSHQSDTVNVNKN
jgi:hypothetical protein